MTNANKFEVIPGNDQTFAKLRNEDAKLGLGVPKKNGGVKRYKVKKIELIFFKLF
jgi:hypothetical protein